MRGGRTFALTFAAAAALASVPAVAALTDCKPPKQDSTYVVYLSEPEFTKSAFADRDEMRIKFFDVLHKHLDQRRDRRLAEIDSIDFSVARCAGRQPSFDGSEFTADVASNLYARNVVVEIWGKLDRPGQPPVPTAHMNYLIVPIRGGVLPGSQSIPAMHRFDYPDREIVARDFIQLVSNNDLHAFVASAIGVSAFFGNDFKLAQEMLCRSASELQRTENRLMAAQATQPQARSIGKLRAYLLELSGKSIAAGRQQSPQLRLLNPANPCPPPP